MNLRIALAALVGLLLIPITLTLWFTVGHPPVAVADRSIPYERQFAHWAIERRMAREVGKSPNLVFDEDNLLAGAHIYAEKCAFCHGLHGAPSVAGPLMKPPAPPLWEQHKNSAAVGVSDDPIGESYWKIANGIRLTGMPAYKNALTSDEIWQVSLLISNADKPLPPSVLDLIRGNAAANAAPASPADAQQQLQQQLPSNVSVAPQP